MATTPTDVAKDAAAIFNGCDAIRKAIAKAVNDACKERGNLAPQRLAQMVRLPHPAKVARALNGHPEYLDERMALRLMAPLGISLEQVLPDYLMMDTPLAEWEKKRIKMGNRHLGSRDRVQDDLTTRLFIRLQAISALG
jgi:hypothetical protein